MSAYPDELRNKQIRAKEVKGHAPQTSLILHEQIYDLTKRHASEGSGIIEVGAFSGGTTIVLGHICGEQGWPLYVVELNPGYAALTEQVLTHVGDRSKRTISVGNLANFIQKHTLEARPLLMFIDANHDYSAVKQDIAWMLAMPLRPRFALFHDFNLRSTNPAHGDIRVDDAIWDSFGRQVPLTMLGAKIELSYQWTKDNPSPSGSYWQAGGYEAALLDLNNI